MPFLMSPTRRVLRKALFWSDRPVLPVTLPEDEKKHPHRVEWWYWVSHVKQPEDAWDLGFTVCFIVLKEDFGFGPATVGMVHVIEHERGKQPLVERAQLMWPTYSEPSVPPHFRFDFRPRILGPGSWSTFSMEGGMGIYDLKLTGPRGIELRLVNDRPAAMLGSEGVMTMANNDALAYYCWPHLRASGSILASDGRSVEVEGQAWMDRQWGDIDIRQFRWKYLTAHLDNGEKWVFFRVLHLESNAVTIYGACIGLDGCLRSIPAEKVQIDDVDVRGQYPLRSRVVIEEEGLNLQYEPFHEDQEVSSEIWGVPPFWEGACQISGTAGGIKVSGVGMTELANIQG